MRAVRSLLHSASLLSVGEGGRRIEGGDRTVCVLLLC